MFDSRIPSNSCQEWIERHTTKEITRDTECKYIPHSARGSEGKPKQKILLGENFCYEKCTSNEKFLKHLSRHVSNHIESYTLLNKFPRREMYGQWLICRYTIRDHKYWHMLHIIFVIGVSELVTSFCTACLTRQEALFSGFKVQRESVAKSRGTLDLLEWWTWGSHRLFLSHH